jgi:hypothetical protein
MASEEGPPRLERHPPVDRHLLADAIDASLLRGFKGALVTGAVLAGGSLLADRYWSYWRGFTPPAKVFFIGSGMSMAAIISAERYLSNVYRAYRACPDRPLPVYEDVLRKKSLVDKIRHSAYTLPGKETFGGALVACSVCIALLQL